MKKGEKHELIFLVALKGQMSFLLDVRTWLILSPAMGALGLRASRWMGWRVQVQYDASMLFPRRSNEGLGSRSSQYYFCKGY